MTPLHITFKGSLNPKKNRPMEQTYIILKLVSKGGNLNLVDQ